MIWYECCLRNPFLNKVIVTSSMMMGKLTSSSAAPSNGSCIGIVLSINASIICIGMCSPC